MSDPTKTYLTANIESASPARLRLMLIERAAELATSLASRWQADPEDRGGASEETLKLLDILVELLSGVTGSSDREENDTCRKVSDLYVFLIQHLMAAEEIGDAQSATEIAVVLNIEAETWRAVCAAGNAETPHSGSGTAGLNFTA